MLSSDQIMRPPLVQGRWMQPFLKMEADALLAAGYRDLGWREVSSEAFGVPNPKRHVILVATAKQQGLVDSLLFSTVCTSCDFTIVFVCVCLCVWSSDRVIVSVHVCVCICVCLFVPVCV